MLAAGIENACAEVMMASRGAPSASREPFRRTAETINLAREAAKSACQPAHLSLISVTHHLHRSKLGIAATGRLVKAEMKAKRRILTSASITRPAEAREMSRDAHVILGGRRRHSAWPSASGASTQSSINKPRIVDQAAARIRASVIARASRIRRR